jgi:hypothetical protein
VSEQGDKTAADHEAQPAGTGRPATEQLSKLMAQDAKASGSDLERKALAAAEAAIAEGQRALDLARAQLREAPPAPAPKKRRKHELLLRALLLVNLAAMIAVAALPQPARKSDAPPSPVEVPPPPAHDPVVETPRLDDPVVRAFAAADKHDYRGAIALLEQVLADSPRLDPAKKTNVLLALEHYASQLGDIPRAQEYQRRTEALRSSHSLPEDLIQMAQEAEKNGDVESMRRSYARLLLQQRQIPSALYRHVAEAYLKLGDSYRQEAEQADARAQQADLQQLREKLRQQAAGGDGKEKR